MLSGQSSESEIEFLILLDAASAVLTLATAAEQAAAEGAQGVVEQV